MPSVTIKTLHRENRIYDGSGGTSRGSRTRRFTPAFRDGANGRVYLSRFADGRSAPVHVLDGLPADLVLDRGASGTVSAVKVSVIAGFLRGRRFYTRAQAAAQVALEVENEGAAR